MPRQHERAPFPSKEFKVTVVEEVPTLTNVSVGGGTFAHLASGGGWQMARRPSTLIWPPKALASGLRQCEIAAGVLYRGKEAQDFVEFGQLKQFLR